MFPPSDKNSMRTLARTRAGKWLLLLVALVFGWQLMVSTQHKHDLSSHSSDCVSCFVASNLSSDPPPAVVTPVAAAAAVIVAVITGALFSSFLAPLSFLIPDGQGPPRISLVS